MKVNKVVNHLRFKKKKSFNKVFQKNKNTVQIIKETIIIKFKNIYLLRLNMNNNNNNNLKILKKINNR